MTAVIFSVICPQASLNLLHSPWRKKVQRVWKGYSKNSLIVVFFLGCLTKKVFPSMVKQWASFNSMRKVNVSIQFMSFSYLTSCFWFHQLIGFFTRNILQLWFFFNFCFRLMGTNCITIQRSCLFPTYPVSFLQYFEFLDTFYLEPFI